MVTPPELSKDFALFLSYSHMGMLKSVSKAYHAPQRINSALTNTFIPVFLQLRCRDFISSCLWGAIPAQNVCLAEERSIPPTHKLLTGVKCQPLAQRAQSSAGGEQVWRVIHPCPTLVLQLQGKHNALCGVNEQHQRGHRQWMCFWDVDSCAED